MLSNTERINKRSSLRRCLPQVFPALDYPTTLNPDRSNKWQRSCYPSDCVSAGAAAPVACLPPVRQTPGVPHEACGGLSRHLRSPAQLNRARPTQANPTTTHRDRLTSQPTNHQPATNKSPTKHFTCYQQPSNYSSDAPTPLTLHSISQLKSKHATASRLEHEPVLDGQ
jgi:hypothetical protein